MNFPSSFSRAMKYAQVSGRDVVLGLDGLLEVDDLVQTDVGVEGGLDVIEHHDGTVSATLVSAEKLRQREAR